MKELWVSLADLPAQGADFVIEDAEVWRAPAEEFGLDCRMPEPPRAELHVLPVDAGFLVRGRLTGRLILPCGRCAEDAELRLDERFEQFLTLAPEEAGEEEMLPEFEEERRLRIGKNGLPEIDLAGLCCEEFLLALPVKALCRPDCMGLCPDCGVNRNTAPCACGAPAGDPRLAVLRGMKVKST